MPTNRNVLLIAGGSIAIGVIAFLGGRRVESQSGKAEPATMPSTSAAPTVSAAAASPAAHPSTPDVGPAASLMPLGNPSSAADLFTRLQAERDSRLKLEPTADSVFAAMKKLGVQVDEELQVAGFVVGARFCNKVRTKSDVHVVVCEYTDEAAAIKGVAFGQNDAIKGREVLRNKTTTCAVHQAEAKVGAAEAAKIKELFKAM